MIQGASLRKRIAATIAGAVLGLVLSPLLIVNAARRRRIPTRRVLVVELWGLGDVVLMTGALTALRRALPAARITVLAKAHACPVLEGSGVADEIVSYDFPWTAFSAKYDLRRYRFREIARLLLRLRAARFDLVVNGRSDVRNNLLLALMGARRSVSLACGAGDVLVDESVPSRGVDAHRVDDWADVVGRALSAPDAVGEPALTVATAETDAARRRLGLDSPRARPVVGIHAGARIAVRRWPAARFAEVADELSRSEGAHVVVFADPDGEGADLPMTRPYTVVRGSLREMMAAMACCDVVVCNDSGPMHVAAALGVSTVAVFGPMRPEWFGPRGSGHAVVHIERMACRPCFDRCRFEEVRCLAQIEADAVLAAVRRVLRVRAPRSLAVMAGVPAA